MAFDEKEWFLLLQLSKIGALSGIETTTTELASMLSISQQTVSRRLRALVQKGFVSKILDKDRDLFKISEKGKTVLHSVYYDLKSALMGKEKPHYYGHVQSGLGEGKFYVLIPEYNAQFTAIIGSAPFPGTLNIVMESENLEDFYYTLTQKQSITIHGFESNERTYGDVKCYPICLLSNGQSKETVECLLVDIKRTSHQKGTIELVSAHHLREKMQLIDGSLIRIIFCEK